MISHTNAQRLRLLILRFTTFLQSRGEMGGDLLNVCLDFANISHGNVWGKLILTQTAPTTDTPEMQPSMIMQTLRSVRNTISIDLHTIGTHEMQTPRYSVKWTLGSANSITTPRHFGNKFLDSLAKQTKKAS